MDFEKASQWLHAEHYTARLEQLGRQFLRGGDDAIEASKQFHQNWGQLNAAHASVSQAREPVEAVLCVRLAQALGLFHLQVSPITCLTWFHCGRRAAATVGDVKSQTHLLGSVGTQYQRLDRLKRAAACHRKAGRIAQRNGWKGIETYQWRGLGQCYSSMGRLRLAVAFYERSLEIKTTANDFHHEKAVLNNLGNIYWNLGNPKMARKHYRQALGRARALGDREGMADNWASIASCFRKTSNLDRIEFCLTKTISLIQKTLVRGREAGLWAELGNLHGLRGQYEDALACYERSLRLERELGNLNVESSHLSSIAGIYAESGRDDVAETYVQRALDIAAQSQDVKITLSAQNSLARQHLSCQRISEAIRVLRRALKQARNAGYVRYEWMALHQLGNACIQKGNPQRAVLLLRAAVKLAEAARRFDDSSRSLVSLGDAVYLFNKRFRAVRVYHRGLRLAQETGDRSVEAHHLEKIAKVYYEGRRLSRAIGFLRRAYKLTRSMGLVSEEGRLAGLIGQCYKETGSIEEAVEWFEEALLSARKANSFDFQRKLLLPLGALYRQKGRIDLAVECLKQKLRLEQQSHDQTGEAIAHLNIGRALVQAGRIRPSIRRFQAAADLARTVGADELALEATMAQGEAEAHVEEHDAALGTLISALELAREIQDPEREAKVETHLGHILASLRPAEAVAHYERSLQIAEETGRQDLAGAALCDLGVIYYQWADYTHALYLFNQACEIATELKNRLLEGICLFNQGDALCKLCQMDVGMARAREGIAVLRQVDPSQAEALRGQMDSWAEEQRNESLKGLDG